MLTNYFKIAWRNLAKNKVSSFINMVGLTLGVSTCLVIYLVTSFELSYDRFHADREQIYRLVGKMKYGLGEENPAGFVPYAMPMAVREEVSGIETVAAFHNFEATVKIPDGNKEPKVFERRNMEADPAGIIIAEPSYFYIFQYEWLAGNPKTALNEPYQVVLSEKKARKYFGNLLPEEMLGKEVIYMDSLRMSVSGIVKDWEKPTDFTFTDFLSFSTIQNSIVKNFVNLNEWNDVWSASQAFVKLSKGVKPAQIEAQFPAFSKSHFTGAFQFKPVLQPLSDLHFNTEYADNYSRKAHLPTLYGLIGIASFILIIAAINFINLSTAQSFRRAKEVGIRKVLGSDRKSLILQFMSETFILTTFSILFSLLIVPKALAVFESFIPKGVGLIFTTQTCVFLGIITCVTTLLSGSYPSLILSSYLPVFTLKGQNLQHGGEKGYLRKALIVFQFTVSLMFILGTMLVSRQISFMRHKDLGFQSEAVITLQAPKGPGNNLPVLYQKIQQLVGVQKAALQIFEPMGLNYGVDKVIYKDKTEQEFDAAYKMGDENFISFYEMKMLAGRNVMKSDTAKEFVISASFVKALGFQHPEEAIGKQLQWHEKYYPIVGVVADFHQQSMHEKIPPTFITTTPWANSIAVKLKDRDAQKAQATIGQIEKLWKDVYPDNKFEYRFLDDTIAQFFEKEQRTALLVNLATFIAIFISCLGLYGLSTFTAAQRTKEIGIRKIMGASVADIVTLLSKDFFWLVGIAAILAFPVAGYFMSQWLQDFAYRVDIQWWMFALAGIAALGIALLAVSFQAVRVAVANPVESLKNE